MRISLILISLFTTLTVGYGQNVRKQQLKNLKKCAKLLTGEFSNKAQVDTTKSPLYTHQLFRGKGLKIKSKTVKWVQFGWFHPKNDLKPIDQWLLRFEALDDGRITMEQYYIPASAIKEGSWLIDEKKLEIEKLHKDVCKCRVQTLDENGFDIKASKPYCRNLIPDYPFQQVQVHLKVLANEIAMYSNFYNDSGDLLFGFPNGNHFIAQ